MPESYDYDRVEIKRQENRKLRMQLTAAVAGLAVVVAGIAGLWIELATSDDARPRIVTAPQGELVCEWVPEVPES